MTALFTLLREKNTHQQHTSTTHINKHTSTTQKWIGPRWIGQNWLAKWAEKWIFKNTQNSTKGPPRERRKKENCGGRGKTKSDFFLRSGGEEGSRGGRGGPKEHPHLGHTHENLEHNTQQTHNTRTHIQHKHNTHTNWPKFSLAKYWPIMDSGKTPRWPKMDCPKLDWPKSIMTAEFDPPSPQL